MGEKLYLIHKSGRGFYRPEAKGYTAYEHEAGRFTETEAIAYTHPNGLVGPRDGLTYREAPDATANALRFTYRNWRGETADRTATPVGFRYGSTKWHPTPGWLMRAFDHDKGAEREFALADCCFLEARHD